jgi:hypothetical protein
LSLLSACPTQPYFTFLISSFLRWTASVICHSSSYVMNSGQKIHLMSKRIKKLINDA